jgi:hypothetical protein
MRLATSLLLGLIFTAQAFAADAPRVQTVPAPASEPPTVPGGDIFGFTSATDVGSPGDRGVAFETSHRAGRREGRYSSGTLKMQLGFTIGENLAVAVSPFVTWHRIRDSAVFADVGRTEFDGLSGELSWRFLPRTASGIAATFSMEPRWARVDGLSGLRVDAFSTEFKLFVDAVLIPNTLYGALNLNWAPGTSRTRDVGIGPWENSSGTNVSLALAYQVTENLFVGAEARLLSAFDGAFLNRNTGNALFVGPTALVRLNERVAINAVWTPQVAGASRPSNGRLDLDNFERHQFRVKTSIAF